MSASKGPMVEWRDTLSARSSLMQVLEARRDAYRQRRLAAAAARPAGRNGVWHGHGDGDGPGADLHDGRTSAAGAARSLELMRGLLQPAISKDIKEVLDKYQERFFQPAVRNMRDNFALRQSLPGAPPTSIGAEGYGTMLDEQLQLMIQHVLEEAKLMYAVEPPHSPPSPRSCRNRRLERRSPAATSTTEAIPPADATLAPAAVHAAVGTATSAALSSATPQQPPRMQQPLQRLQQPPPQPLQPPPAPPQPMQQQRAQPPHPQPAPAPTTTPPSTPTPAVALATLMTGGPGSANPPPATLQQMFKRRKEMDAEAEARKKRARLAAFFAKRQAPAAGGGPAAAPTVVASPRVSPDSSPGAGPPSASPAVPGRPARVPSGSGADPGTPSTPPSQLVNYHSPHWDPCRIATSTEFIMGARANKVLGYETSRGRLYTKHPELFKYPSDQEDREWLARSSLIQPTGGKAFVCVLRDVAGLAASQEYRNNPLVNLAELKGFRVPEFMLNKIRDYMSSLRTEPLSEVAERGLAEVSPPPPSSAPSSEQQGVVVVDCVPLVQLNCQAASPAPSTPAAAVLSSPARTANSTASAPAVVLATGGAPASAPGLALTPGALLTTLPPSLESPAATPAATPAAAPSGAAAAAAAAVAAAAASAGAAAVNPGAAVDVGVTPAVAATVDPGSTVIGMVAPPGPVALASLNPAILTAVASATSTIVSTMTAAAATPTAATTASASMPSGAPSLVAGLGGPTGPITASSTPASPSGPGPGPGPSPKGLLIRSHSMPCGTFVVEPLVLDELELYIKETRGADEGSLDLNLEDVDVHLDVGGGEHGQLELAWDFIGELHTSMPSPATSAADGLLADDVSADDSTADGATLMAHDILVDDVLVDDVLVDDATAEDVMVVRGLTADVMIGGDTSIVRDDLTMARDDEGAVGPDEVALESDPDLETMAGTEAAQQLAAAATSGPLDGDGPLDASSLSMGHVSLSALLSGSVMEGLDIPEGLL